ncbi:exo-alpha-sialidase [Candidatus Daviesbacteria bacterium]|nr:exo-alpha-sialidase [Candidatus Daviesbacteria bacterium]
MFKIIPFVILLLIIMLLFFKPVQKEEPVVNSDTTDKISLNNVEVDSSEDYRALGFSGQKKLVSDSQGNIYVTYRKKANSYYEIFVAKLKKDEDSYQVVFKKNVSNINNKVNQRVPSIAIDSKEQLHLVWYGSDSNNPEGNRQIKYSNSKDGGETWAKPINISYVEGFKGQNLWQEHPDIWVSKSDNLFIVWEGKDKESNDQLIKFSKSEDGGKVWSDWKDISVSSGSQSRPTIIQDKNNSLYVFMYSKQKSTNSQIWYSTSENEGETWSDWKNISNSSKDSKHLSVTLDSKNNTHLVWREFNQSLGKTQIMYSKFNGQAYSQPEIISESKNFQFFPQIGVSNDDTIFIAWVETNDKSGFPEDDPKEGTAYLAVKNNGQSSPSKKLLIANEAYFPNIIPQSKTRDSFILFSVKEQNYSIFLSKVSF